VATLISSIISKPIPMTLEICALGLIHVSLSLSGYHTKIIDMSSSYKTFSSILLEEHRRSIHWSL